MKLNAHSIIRCGINKIALDRNKTPNRAKILELFSGYATDKSAGYFTFVEAMDTSFLQKFTLIKNVFLRYNFSTNNFLLSRIRRTLTKLE
jgi:hypothetical protein